MNRSPLIRLFILNAIADDYEDLPRILKEVSDLGGKSGVTIASAEILPELINLIETDLAKAYRLSPILPVEEIDGVPPPGEIEGCYFWITAKGSAELRSAEWPFGDV